MTHYANFLRNFFVLEPRVKGAATRGLHLLEFLGQALVKSELMAFVQLWT
jgi:hypothetical protein